MLGDARVGSTSACGQQKTAGLMQRETQLCFGLLCLCLLLALFLVVALTVQRMPAVPAHNWESQGGKCLKMVGLKKLGNWRLELLEWFVCVVLGVWC